MEKKELKEEIKKVLEGKSIYEMSPISGLNPMTKEEIIYWIVETYIDQELERIPEETKEGENDYEIGFNDGWHTCCRENNIENDARILYLRRKENINRFKESLTNQKKVI